MTFTEYFFLCEALSIPVKINCKLRNYYLLFKYEETEAQRGKVTA